VIPVKIKTIFLKKRIPIATINRDLKRKINEDKMKGYRGGIHAVGPVGSLKGLLKPFPATIAFAI
jgi:hypothetical protein